MKIVVDGKVIAEAGFQCNSLKGDTAFFSTNIEYEGGYLVNVATIVGEISGAKIQAIKAARAVFKIGLGEAKAFVEGGGIVKSRTAYDYQWVCSLIPGVSVTLKELPIKDGE
jgi:ribosomal protein L7/L12